MAHIHEKIDFTVAIFVVQDGQVLIIHHRKLDLSRKANAASVRAFSRLRPHP